MNTILIKGKKKISKVFKQKINRWKYPFQKVGIPSSMDGVTQKAYYFNPHVKEKTPLIVSLHSWAGNYEQVDPGLSRFALESKWNYIHPDFRGVNNSPEACGSDLSMSDINDAIQYAIDNGNVDTDNIFIVGGSGGAYAGLCFYSSSKHPINSYLIWNPITDLIAWHDQSIIRESRYSQDIMNGTDSINYLNVEEAKKRSPLYRTPRFNSNLFIFAGYHDGYAENPVPITHSLNYYNKYVSKNNANTSDLISKNEIIRLAAREYAFKDKETIGGRKVVISKSFKNAQITVFDGGHEQLIDHTINLINANIIINEDVSIGAYN